MCYEEFNKDTIKQEKRRYTDYPVPKWLLFCEKLLKKGYKISVCKARSTRSKYIIVATRTQSWKVRFSNHKPNRYKQDINDCNYYVGVSHTGAITTEEVYKKILKETLKEK